jgi:hypothetical protein
MKLTTHIHLVLSLGMCGTIPPLPHMSAWHGAWLSTGYIFMVWYLLKHRDNFAFTLLATDCASKSHHSSVGIALVYRLDDWGSRVRFLMGAGNFSLHYHVQDNSGAHPASYPMGTSSSFPAGKVARA